MSMNFDEELPDESTEIGSDELLSDDNLRLPESANALVRLHAVRAWLTRRQLETTMEIGEAALALQQAFQEPPLETRLRRRERQNQPGSVQRMQRAQQELEEAQLLLQGYEEAQTLLEDVVSHTTSGERVLVEYYLTLEELVQSGLDADNLLLPKLQALGDVLHRIERVESPNEE